MTDAATGEPDLRPGLRERKKQRTHDDLQRIAIRLFLARGYEAVTVDEIAAAADVSHRTFYRYFASKEDLVLGEIDDVVTVVRELLDARPDDESILDGIRAVTVELTALLTGDPEEDRARIEIVRANPALQQRSIERQPRLEAALVPFVARRLGVEPDQDLLPQLVSSCTVAATRAAFDVWAARGSTDPLADLLDEALRWLEVGFGDRLRPATARP